LGVPDCTRPPAAQERGVTPLRRREAATLQLNIGLYCNQACSHCHVESSPRRTEAMDAATAARCIALLARRAPAPAACPCRLRWLVQTRRGLALAQGAARPVIGLGFPVTAAGRAQGPRRCADGGPDGRRARAQSAVPVRHCLLRRGHAGSYQR
jgi:hypothetical protein